MAGLVPAIHAFLILCKDVDARHIGERSDAVLRTAMAGHDESEIRIDQCKVGRSATTRRSIMPINALRFASAAASSLLASLAVEPFEPHTTMPPRKAAMASIINCRSN